MNIFIRYFILPSITVIIIFVFISSNIKGHRKASESKNQESIKKIQEEPIKYDKPINISKNNDFVYPINNIRDPFKKFVPRERQYQINYTIENEPSIKLSGIIRGKDSPLAIIKTKDSSFIAKAGEKVNNIKILSIEEKSIKIIRNGKIEHLQLWIDK